MYLTPYQLLDSHHEAESVSRESFRDFLVQVKNWLFGLFARL